MKKAALCAAFDMFKIGHSNHAAQTVKTPGVVSPAEQLDGHGPVGLGVRQSLGLSLQVQDTFASTLLGAASDAMIGRATIAPIPIFLNTSRRD